ncbi:MAG: phosphoglycerate mutase family protein [Muribaculaceae bacterium]|nr:phosphoglycerate mutase family protein [Muribaculaceae bacterium]
MNQKEISHLATAAQEKAYRVLNTSGIVQVWEEAGCRVNLVGSLRMGLLVTHRDIDLHVYSSGITEASTFAIAARISAIPGVMEITCINGLHTDEHCMAWHVKYRTEDDEIWKFDIIHIEAGTEYDGYFERMAERIMAVMTPSQRDTILRLKAETPSDESIKGVEYYEAVIAEGITELEDLRKWVRRHRLQAPYYWIP